jgi:hypothetical protein
MVIIIIWEKFVIANLFSQSPIDKNQFMLQISQRKIFPPLGRFYFDIDRITPEYFVK